jgi:hypothetical protein
MHGAEHLIMNDLQEGFLTTDQRDSTSTLIVFILLPPQPLLLLVVSLCHSDQACPQQTLPVLLSQESCHKIGQLLTTAAAAASWSLVTNRPCYGTKPQQPQPVRPKP